MTERAVIQTTDVQIHMPPIMMRQKNLMTEVALMLENL